MIEIALTAIALAGPATCPPPGAPGAPCPPPGVPIPTPIGGFVPQPLTFAITAAPTIHVGEDADFYITDTGGSSTEPPRLCYQVGTSMVGCATTSGDWFHLTIRRGSTQYLTVRVGRKIYARAVYHDGKLIS